MIAVGQTIGNYTITAKLGEGGMGIVYLAEHPVIGRKVAMKAIHPELSRNPEVVSRFMTEAKSVNQIGNEHIVDINDFGTTADGEFYFIMEFLQGESLADKLKRERLLVAPRALQIAAQVADALAASHSHGIIHRDLKPENIFLITRGSNSDFVKVLDFGLAKLTLSEEKVTHKTRTGSVMGTPYYMAPEQCEGKATIDHRADLYSLGVILFEMLTGEVPFGGDGYGEIIVKHITMPPPSPRSLNPQLTGAHEAILARALAKNREDRFDGMAEFRAAMLDPEKYAATAPSLVRGVPPRGAQPEPARSADDEVSGQVVFGAPERARIRPSMPSTFRHGVGELIDEGDQIPKSRKGLVVATVVAALTAGAAGIFLYGNKHDAPPGQTPAVVSPPIAQPAPPPVAPAIENTIIKFESKPEGATVLRKDTGAVLGTTPFEHAVPSGKNAIEFLFRKNAFEDTSLRVVPKAPTALLATVLVPQRAPEPEPVAAPPTKSASASRSSRPRASSVRSKKPARKVNDEDGVLEPSFK